MGPERNGYIVPYGVVYDPSRPKRVKRERHLLVWSFSDQVGGIKRIKRVRLYLKWCPGVVEHSFIKRVHKTSSPAMENWIQEMTFWVSTLHWIKLKGFWFNICFINRAMELHHTYIHTCFIYSESYKIGRNMTPGGGGTSLHKLYRYVPPHRVGFLRRFSENGYRLGPIWSGIGYGFGGNYGSAWTYL